MNFNVDDTRGAVLAILAWYWSDEDDLEDLLRGIRLTSKFIEGDTSRFTEHDFWIFYDALGSYSDKEAFGLEGLCQTAEAGWKRTGRQT